MLLLGVLFFPLAAALLVYLLGNKQAKYIAFGAAAIEFVASYMLKRSLSAGGLQPLVYSHAWITNPHISFAVSVDGLSSILIILTTFLVPLIILTTYRKEIDNAKSFYALVLFMQFALIGVFTASDGFLFYIFLGIGPAAYLLYCFAMGRG